MHILHTYVVLSCCPLTLTSTSRVSRLSLCTTRSVSQHARPLLACWKRLSHRDRHTTRDSSSCLLWPQQRACDRSKRASGHTLDHSSGGAKVGQRHTGGSPDCITVLRQLTQSDALRHLRKCNCSGTWCVEQGGAVSLPRCDSLILILCSALPAADALVAVLAAAPQPQPIDVLKGRRGVRGGAALERAMACDGWRTPEPSRSQEKS
jgi:hypothetical protein